MFGNRKKKVAQRMIAGVDAIKLTIYKTMTATLTDKYPDKGHDICGGLAAAAVNDIYSCHSQDTQKTYEDNQEIIETELTDLATTNPDLKQPITDSLRVFVQANQMLGSPSMNDMEFVMALFQKAKDRGLFIKGGDAPKPETFLQMADDTARRYGIK